MQILPIAEVDRRAVATCLALVEARDPLVIPADPEAVVAADALAAVDDAAVVGVGWRAVQPEGVRLEVRVPPGRRRRGVGGALFEQLAAGPGPLIAGCDAGHPSVGRFLRHRGFELVGLVLHQRWDGTLADVPPAFRTATIDVDPDHDAVWALLREATEAVWPTPVPYPDRPPALVLSARQHGERVGGLVATRDPDALDVAGVGVLPAHRNGGVGRALMASAMRVAAAADLGLTLRVGHQAEDTQRWTASLGFWTYRTWAWHRRGA